MIFFGHPTPFWFLLVVNDYQIVRNLSLLNARERSLRGLICLPRYVQSCLGQYVLHDLVTLDSGEKKMSLDGQIRPCETRLCQWRGWLLGLRQDPPPPKKKMSFWSFFTFVVQKKKLEASSVNWHKKLQMKSWWNVPPPKLLACCTVFKFRDTLPNVFSRLTLPVVVAQSYYSFTPAVCAPPLQEPQAPPLQGRKLIIGWKTWEVRKALLDVVELWRKNFPPYSLCLSQKLPTVS